MKKHFHKSHTSAWGVSSNPLLRPKFGNPLPRQRLPERPFKIEPNVSYPHSSTLSKYVKSTASHILLGLFILYHHVTSNDLQKWNIRLWKNRNLVLLPRENPDIFHESWLSGSIGWKQVKLLITFWYHKQGMTSVIQAADRPEKACHHKNGMLKSFFFLQSKASSLRMASE